MTDRPILFSAPMIRAILREIEAPGTGKTQTRRVVKDVPVQPEANCHPRHKAKHAAPYLDSYCSERMTPQNPRGMSTDWCWWQVDDRQCLPTFKVKCAPGARLWVRETWAAGAIYDGMPPRDINPDGKPGWCGIRYAATDSRSGIKDRPSTHMPRWASRLTLYVTDVRVERLQDISEDDALAEGVPSDEDYQGSFNEEYCRHCGGSGVHNALGSGYGVTEVDCAKCETPELRYRNLWDHINGPGSWDANPFVVAYTFTPRLGNIDASPSFIGEAA